jgi:hypothetical protein
MDTIQKKKTILLYTYNSTLFYEKIIKKLRDKTKKDYEEYLKNTKNRNIHELNALEQCFNNIDKLYQDAVKKTNRAYHSYIKL